MILGEAYRGSSVRVVMKTVTWPLAKSEKLFAGNIRRERRGE